MNRNIKYKIVRKQHFRKYGKKPYKVFLLHGGPGAPGSMASFARKLSENYGIVESFQTEKSLKGQIHQLKKTIQRHGNLPVKLIGSSWGAMLGYIFSAHHPSLVEKLILVGSGVFESKYAAGIMETRLKRLTVTERSEIRCIINMMNDSSVKEKDELLKQMEKYFLKSDSYNPITTRSEVIEYRYDVYDKVWSEAIKLRETNKLLNMGSKIQCPVVAIHGDYDPHPSEGVRIPLDSVLSDFRFILLAKCGHLPWIEKEAKDFFYTIIVNEL